MCKICVQCDKCGEKNLSVDFFFHDLSGERKFFTATSRTRWKKLSPLKLQILQIFTPNFNAYLKFRGNIIEVSDRRRSGIRSCWHAGGENFEPMYGSFLEEIAECGENKFSMLKTANLTKIHRFQRIQRWRCGRFAVKKVVFTAIHR